MQVKEAGAQAAAEVPEISSGFIGVFRALTEMDTGRVRL